MNKFISTAMIIAVLCGMCMIINMYNKESNRHMKETTALETTNQRIINIQNNEEFAKILLYGDCRGYAVGNFANSHIGSIIEFDGYVADRKNYVYSSKVYDNRFNYKILYGDGEKTNEDCIYPIFLIENIGYLDLKPICSDAVNEFEIGDKLHIVAEIEEYEAGYITLIPIKIVVR